MNKLVAKYLFVYIIFGLTGGISITFLTVPFISGTVRELIFDFYDKYNYFLMFFYSLAALLSISHFIIEEIGSVKRSNKDAKTK